ncbi:MAG: PASTA domain-containing protein, partial [Oscillospiraceae bacterium]|nr:PASTA domain-containing protein [Oscillospiraceae bacterium]
MGERRLCYGCMEFKDSDHHVCPSCGYADDTSYDPNYIKPGTILAEKYVIGTMIGVNSEGATYIGYNQSIGCRILIREYMPKGLCSRVKGKSTISVDPQHVVQYKALMAEFSDLNKSLAHMRNVSHINPTLDLFNANNTAYAVSEYLEGITLIDFLKDNAGELTWKQVSEMFPSFFTTISILHNNGIIHRAISPDTIYVTDHSLRLCAFSISAVRTVHTELPCEIFHGYAAPEQYSQNARQGTWTDVYGLCAVLYRILTGCKPTDAPSRMQNDNLCAPHEMNPNIPKHVSLVIMKGLSLFSDDRIKTVTELVTELFDEPEEAQSHAGSAMEPAHHAPAHTHEPEAYRRPYRDYDEVGYDDRNSGSVIDRIKIPVIIGVLLTCVLLIIAFAVLNMLDMNPIARDDTTRIETTVASIPDSVLDNVVTETNPPESTNNAPEADSYIPDLIGKQYEMKKSQLESNGWLYLEPVYEYSDEYKAGLIIAQSKKAGEPFVSGSTIEVTVSKGPSSIKLPEFEGKTLAEYEEELKKLGLTNYNTESVVNYKYQNNEVIELSKEAGEEFDLTGAETLKIYYASNPETTPANSGGNSYTPPAPVETEPEETEAPEVPDVPDVPVEENPPAPEENGGGEAE